MSVRVLWEIDGLLPNNRTRRTPDAPERLPAADRSAGRPRPERCCGSRRGPTRASSCGPCRTRGGSGRRELQAAAQSSCARSPERRSPPHGRMPSFAAAARIPAAVGREGGCARTRRARRRSRGGGRVGARRDRPPGCAATRRSRRRARSRGRTRCRARGACRPPGAAEPPPATPGITRLPARGGRSARAIVAGRGPRRRPRTPGAGVRGGPGAPGPGAPPAPPGARADAWRRVGGAADVESSRTSLCFRRYHGSSFSA